ncbi:terminase small subunit [Methyloversatilis discipulorum]|uniref:terminase small subunit n=1 Tax=Methyloversatilis discipulorum TaxID=1119528 RepID=UPI003137ECEC
MLTSKQEAFCLAYIEKENASDAYRSAYEAKNMAPATVNRKAKELLDNGKIAARIAEIRAAAAARVGLTLEQHLNDLKRLRDLAETNGKYGPAVQAEVARGKAAGLYTDKVEHSGEIKTPELKLVLNGTRPPPPAE